MKDLSNYRKSYEKSVLDENSSPENPMELFARWFSEADEAANHNSDEANTMTLSTIGLDGFPKARIVLLKRFNDQAFTFFTNYNSEKGRAIANNPNVSLSFFWPALERQVIIRGIAQKSAVSVSDEYFLSRPLGSRLGAIVSDQSAILESRELLERKLSELEQHPGSESLKRPSHWGGYDVTPIHIEFWQGRANRLHDRIAYSRVESSWDKTRLFP